MCYTKDNVHNSDSKSWGLFVALIYNKSYLCVNASSALTPSSLFSDIFHDAQARVIGHSCHCVLNTSVSFHTGFQLWRWEGQRCELGRMACLRGMLKLNLIRRKLTPKLVAMDHTQLVYKYWCWCYCRRICEIHSLFLRENSLADRHHQTFGQLQDKNTAQSALQAHWDSVRLLSKPSFSLVNVALVDHRARFCGYRCSWVGALFHILGYALNCD